MGKRNYALMMTYIGLILSVFTIVADDRNIVMDDIVTETGIPAWEFGFIIYMLFTTGGMLIEIVTPRTYDMETIGANIIGFVASILILQIVGGMSIGAISTGVGNIETEFYSWYTYLGLVWSLFLIYMFNKR